LIVVASYLSQSTMSDYPSPHSIKSVLRFFIFVFCVFAGTCLKREYECQ
jgi:hypothetical protein